jgi:predicted Zn-dependent peptidase
MPEIREIGNLELPRPELYHLSNGIPVYDTNLGTQDVVKLEIVFFAGRPGERKKLASRGTASLLKEGTTHYSSSDIAEIFDYYGASLSTPVGLDMASILLYSLKKNFEQLLPVVSEMLSEPLFPQKELDAFAERNKQRLQVELTKNDVLAYRKFTELLYGEDHPYGYNSMPETYDALKREDLVAHFEENFTAGNCMIFVSGKTGREVRLLLEQYFGKTIREGARRQVVVPPAKSVPERIKIEHPTAVQTAIRIGCPLFNRLHPDYNGMYLLNTILGGYFGSRLMNNVREEKGYTYNIYSSHEAMLHDGYFYVSTEVGKEFQEATLREIYAEMERLQEKLVGKEEMEMVRNYLLGSLLTNLDGAFNIAEVVKTFVTEGVPLSHFEELVAAVKTISPKEIRALARKYFSTEKMWEVVV